MDLLKTSKGPPKAPNELLRKGGRTQRAVKLTHKQVGAGEDRVTVRWPASVALAMLLACLVLLPLLGHRVLTDWDEGIYAEIAREMLTGSTLRAWLTPHWNGHLWFEKPPLAMWLMAVSMRLCGLHALGARLPSALAGVGMVGVLHRWMLPRYGFLAAWLGTAILLSAFGFQHAARAGETDTLLSLFCLSAVLGLAGVVEGQARGWLLFWTGFGLAMMTKGAGSITLPLTLAALLALQPHQVLRFPRAWSAGLALFAGIAVPWHALMWAQYGHAFVSEYVGFHTLHRATTAIEGHQTGPWFYLWVLLISAPPFALLYPFALAAPFRSQATTDLGLRVFSLFALTVLCLFSLVKTRLPHYIAPVYPALSALTAVLLARLFSRLRVGWRPLTAGAAALYGLAALATTHARGALHSAHLPDGRLTPDNRDVARLLQQAQPQLSLAPGPLLLWRANAATPVTTAAFYSRHLVQQVALTLPAAGIPQDPYVFAPAPLLQAAGGGEHLLLMDCNLLPSLPETLGLRPLLKSPTLLLAEVHPAREAQHDASLGRQTRQEQLCPGVH